MARGRRRKLHFSQLYSFACGRSKFDVDHSQIGGPGFSRVAYANEPDCFEAGILNYGSNYVSTTKYTLATFFPKSLFEQFRRVANIYFLFTGCLSFTPLAPYSAISAILPLIVVIGATMAKEAIEDWRRYQQDLEVNNRKVKIHRGDGTFEFTEWKNLRVGDIVKVEKDNFFPADLVMLASGYDDGLCYVETMNLDGETNLKLKQALDATSGLQADSGFQNFKAIIKCEDPNASLYTFVGTMEYEEQQYPLSPQQLLLRDSKLRNTDYIYGVVVFTGHDTKTIFINQDIQMYHEESDKPAHARTSNLNEELGQVDTILSDKTGTLTCNSMEFIKCSIAGTAYGHGFTEVERAMARRKGSPLMENEQSEENYEHPKLAVKGFNFDDERIMNGNWVNEPHSDVVQLFFRLLAVCHTAIPEVDEETGKISYEAESPDEAAFVIAARELGFEFYQRTQTNICIRELDPVSGMHVEKSYKLLSVLEFNSTRKRMSVILQDEEGKLLLLSKGADRLAQDGREFEDKTKEQMHEYADAGLRTLVLAYRQLDEEEYKSFNEKFMAAKNSVSADRDEKIEEAADSIERDLILLGATAVEDKLQNGVPECIDKLAQAGIKIWVLTGDKMETAINIGYACSLLRQGMKQIIITLDRPEIIRLEKGGNKDAFAKASRDSVIYQINEGKKLLSSSSTESFALIIDGKSLAYALEDDVKNLFLQLAVGCASVICCRSSPKQKALVTRLVKAGTGKVTLGIGDGANDVGMLQEADIGVGISGAEGMQICYFFYKNITFGLTLFLYEAYASFSGQPAYNDWYLSLYNVFFTSLPVIALGVFDQDVSARLCLKFPMLYQEGVQNVLFSWLRILGWMFNGVCNGVMIFFFCTTALQHQAFRKGGEVVDFAVLGATMYTCVVWVVNCQMALSVSYFTLIQHIFIWGGIALWYLFLLAYGAITPTLSTSAFMVFVEGLAPAPSYWITALFVVVATLIPFFTYSVIRMRFFPMYHNMIQWLRFDGHADDPEYCQVVRQRSVRPTTVGVSARIDAKVSQLGRRVHHAVHSP
ncbi:E1-E2 ATPase [Musa troglodytarum]|uniref:Phospholipid-transporting ATPase n=1 Tax=Musa troglodytarum TaxID=320322 RepID=A0A9E7L8G4_9LILI|nr:E1-E2 ATPase [Musa troglodytarum]